MLDREAALSLVKSNVLKRNWVLHVLAVEAIMKGLARQLGEEEEKWGLLGLLHDIDFGQTEKNPKRHGLEAEKILAGKVSDEIIRAIKAHNQEYTGVPAVSKMEKGLIAADALSGLIIASALVMPSRKLEEVSVKTLEKKFRDKDFARGASRERINLHLELDMSEGDFFQIALDSLKEISDTLGL